MERPLRVLVVDDSADVRTTLHTLLQLFGHEVAEAGDPYAALGLAATFRPDAVLLNVILPGLDGFEVARRLRRIPGLGIIVLVAVVGPASAVDDSMFRAAGFDHRLREPVEPTELERLLGTYCTRE